MSSGTGFEAVHPSDGTSDSSSPPLNVVTPSKSTEQDVLPPLDTSPTNPRLPTLRNGPGRQSSGNMTISSSPLGNLNAARRPTLPQSPIGSARGAQLPQDVQAKMKAFHLSRQGAPQNAGGRSTSSPSAPGNASLAPGGALSVGMPSPGIGAPGGPLAGAPGGMRLTPGALAPSPNFANTAPPVNLPLKPKMGLAGKRGLGMGLKLSDATGPPPPSLGGQTNTEGSRTEGQSGEGAKASTNEGSLFNKYSEYVDTATGTLKFKGKATVHGKGIDFSSGTSFSISLDEVDTLDELGKGNYGTVYKVRHSRPQLRRLGQGLAGNKALPSTLIASGLPECPPDPSVTAAAKSSITGAPTGMIMGMKEIRLELDEAKFAAIIMELDILHRCVSPYIIDFYGAFFQEGAVYICMEFMDGGSIDKIYGDGVPEGVLRKIAYSTVMGLKSLKDEHNIIHRDVKPTNILVNTKGDIKICDFGVSGNLVASIAKTNIGCQSYMAPERISGGGVAQAGANPGGGTYSVQSDIWSLGLTIIECALGQYPYPPETYDNIFSQLSAIVDGDPPDLPAETFTETARDFVRKALNKVPKLRPTYAMLLRHPWLAPLTKPETITEEDEEPSPQAGDSDSGEAKTDADKDEDGMHDAEVARWVLDSLERKKNGKMGKKAKPALHAAPLDASISNTTPPTLP